jgi:hypothetical protein
MTKLLELQELSIDIPITSEMRQASDVPAQLGAMAVEAYLEMQGLSIDQGACYWRNSLEKEVIADVVLRDLGRLECLDVMDLGVTIEPIDESYERLGCVIVKVNKTAITIIGFVENQLIDRQNVMSIDDWMLWLDKLLTERAVAEGFPSNSSAPFIRLEKEEIKTFRATNLQDLETLNVTKLLLERQLALPLPEGFYLLSPSKTFRSGTVSIFEAAIAERRGQLSIPHDENDLLQIGKKLQLKDNLLELMTITWRTAKHTEWALLLLLKKESGESLPTGLRLEIRKLQDNITVQDDFLGTPERYFGGYVKGTIGDKFVVTISLEDNKVSLPVFG